MPNSTSEIRKDIGDIYGQVPRSARLMSEAVPYLLTALGLEPSDESEGIESQRIANDTWRIGDTLTKQGYGNFEQTKEYDPKSKEIARHIAGLMIKIRSCGVVKEHQKREFPTKNWLKYL